MTKPRTRPGQKVQPPQVQHKSEGGGNEVTRVAPHWDQTLHFAPPPTTSSPNKQHNEVKVFSKIKLKDKKKR